MDGPALRGLTTELLITSVAAVALVELARFLSIFVPRFRSLRDFRRVEEDAIDTIIEGLLVRNQLITSALRRDDDSWRHLKPRFEAWDKHLLFLKDERGFNAGWHVPHNAVEHAEHTMAWGHVAWLDLGCTRLALALEILHKRATAEP